MKILVSNDDGIYADGIKALVNEMKKLGEVVVSAPATHQSGAGHSITFNQIVKVEKIDFDSDVVGYKVFGKPKDCVELALSVLTSDIDLVITGINEGYNLASDCSASGTCGAACAALPYNIPSIAVSLGFGDHYDYSYAAKVALEVAKWFIEQPFNKDFTLSINVPNIDPKDIKGITVAGFGGYPKYSQDLTGHFDGQYYYYNLRSTDVSFEYTVNNLEGDLYAIDHNYITLTPLSLNMVKQDSLPQLKQAWTNK
ncbi:MAG: 5'/3'-nucleotidase SurE [Erysipelotrichaceae bacterium]|nr:5'/3'-nucleotidase SurE [Erysipelotrichaceae bacterium]MDY3829660.1 5'/3'-nucleotidase SurE [Erysipelotrichaceae bacterium]